MKAKTYLQAGYSEDAGTLGKSSISMIARVDDLLFHRPVGIPEGGSHGSLCRLAACRTGT